MTDVINTDLQGRLRNTRLVASKALFPVFEAVVNSIQSIEDSIGCEKGEIVVKIIRETGFDLGKENPLEIRGFDIIDNGMGFNEGNFDSFKTLDSSYKLPKGCKGMGRLLWLKVFKEVEITSVYQENNIKKKRTFLFNAKNGISNHQIQECEDDVLTIVKMHDIELPYAKTMKQNAESIASLILQHCLWYFLRSGGCPNIKVIDGAQTIDLNDLHNELMLSKSQTKEIEIKHKLFEITHVKLNPKITKNHAFVLCAAAREVKITPLKGKICGLYGAINDSEGDFFLYTYVTSEYLDEKVSPERSEFDIPEKNNSIDFEEICIEDIEKAVIESISEYLSDFLKANVKAVKDKIVDFVEKKSPEYKPFINDIDDKISEIDPNSSDEVLDTFLHKQKYLAEVKLKEDGHKLLSQNIPDDQLDSYEQSLNDYMAKASEMKQADLAKYVAQRRVVLDFLKKAIGIQNDEKYVKERIIHNLIFPMKTTSEEVASSANNLWLIDERLAFHNYLASDKKLSDYDIINVKDDERPDICSLQLYDNPFFTSEKDIPPFSQIVVVELKRPMRDDMTADDNPIDQSLSYIKKIRAGDCKTKSGLAIPKSDEMPGFCYIVADLTDSLRDQCANHGLIESADRMGFFGYIPSRKAYVEVISFNKLYSDALMRNQAFFQKLGLPNI